MGGIRTAGDLVMWMQMARKMRLPEAKQYVAQKLNVDPLDLVDECEMRFLREELGIGTITANPGVPRGIAAKAKIGELLGIEDRLLKATEQNLETAGQLVREGLLTR